MNCAILISYHKLSLISTLNSGGGQALLSAPAYRGLLRLLSTLASKSPIGAKTLLLLGISGVLKNLLLYDGLVASIYDCPTLSKAPEQHRTSQSLLVMTPKAQNAFYEIFEVVNLTNELLPPLPQDIMSIAARSSLFVQGSLYKESPISSTGEEHDMTGNATAISGRVKLLNEQPQLLKKFGLDLLPLLIQMYASSVKAPVRHKSLSIVGEFMHFSTPVNKACIHVSIKH